MSLKDRVKRLEVSTRERNRAERVLVQVCAENCAGCRIEPGQRWCEFREEVSEPVVILDV